MMKIPGSRAQQNNKLVHYSRSLDGWTKGPHRRQLSTHCMCFVFCIIFKDGDFLDLLDNVNKNMKARTASGLLAQFSRHARFCA